MRFNTRTAAFTLVELSIVLVIIGLIIGGVLVGNDLINAATVRKQIKQVEELNTAVNTFKGKYGALPGDMRPSQTPAGFVPRGGTVGWGDGNGLINRSYASISDTCREPVTFWHDLGSAGIWSNHFNGINSGTGNCQSDVTAGGVFNIFEKTSIGQGILYVLTYESTDSITFPKGINLIHLVGAPSSINASGNGNFGSNPAILSPPNAYAIDMKMDDGIPNTGIVYGWERSTGVIAGAVTGNCALINAYKVTNTSLACDLVIRASF